VVFTHPRLWWNIGAEAATMHGVQSDLGSLGVSIMQAVTVQSALGAQLGELNGQAILCDPNGKVLGFFSPLRDRPRLTDLQLEPPLSIAETDELRKVRTGKPLSEILDRLGIQ
jgi:hypothetical protein